MRTHSGPPQSPIDQSAIETLRKCQEDLMERAVKLNRIAAINPDHRKAAEILRLANQIYRLGRTVEEMVSLAQRQAPVGNQPPVPEVEEGSNVIPFPRAMGR